MAPSPLNEERLLLSRQHRSLQARLQQLLDAQSEGLLRGLGRPVEHSVSKERSPETYFSSKSSFTGRTTSSNATPPRQPVSKHITLNASRKGIEQALAELAFLKEEEVKLARSDVEQTVQDLANVKELDAKETHLRQVIRSIEDEEVNRKVQKYRQEEKSLSREIVELENRLWEMQNRQQHLIREIKTLDNKFQSKLSSYKASLDLAEKEARDYLARPPEVVTVDKKDKGPWALPPERRTLSLSIEYLQQKQTELLKVEKDLVSEKTALKEGSVVWQDVVSTVTMAEGILRQEMQRIPDDQGLVDTEISGGKSSLDKVLSTLQEAQSQIERNLNTAQNRGWNLLVCSISAELGAIIEGSDILRNICNPSHDAMTDIPGASDDVEHRFKGPDNSQDAGRSQGQLARESINIDQQFVAYNDEDDGPGPELLISTDDSPS